MIVPTGLKFAHALALAFVFFVTKQDTRRYFASRIRYLSSSSSTKQRPSTAAFLPTATSSPKKSMLKTQTSLNMASADSICDGVIQAAEHDFHGRKPVCVTVLDSSGNILVQKRMDGCPDGAYRKFSHSKARTCIHLQSSTRAMRNKYMASNASPAQFTQASSMVSITNGELVPIAGGVLIQDADGNTVGSVGVSGASSDEDEYMALKGVQNLEEEHGGSAGDFFKTMPEEHSCTTLKP